MKFSLVLAAGALPCVIAAPTESAKDVSFVALEKPKLNQYRSLDDYLHDRNILYHAAPSSGNCYDLDGQTGAFFYNNGGFLLSYASKDFGCNGTGELRLKGGACMEKGLTGQLLCDKLTFEAC